MIYFFIRPKHKITQAWAGICPSDWDACLGYLLPLWGCMDLSPGLAPNLNFLLMTCSGRQQDESCNPPRSPAFGFVSPSFSVALSRNWQLN